jgi:formate hydrogenlyase subunit 3/multisubunit Na+/H+ antiporter MnhD subunit
MLRRIGTLLGLATLIVGVWLIQHEHAQNVSCNAAGGRIPSIANSSCINIAALYFSGFTLVLAGLVVLLISLAAMARKNRRLERQRVRDARNKPRISPGERPPHV